MKVPFHKPRNDLYCWLQSLFISFYNFIGVLPGIKHISYINLTIFNFVNYLIITSNQISVAFG
jgi:hypothetical protein